MKAGWREATIGDVCEVVNGGTPKTGVSTNWGGPHMWITPAEMGRRSDPYVAETDRQLTDAGLASANLLPPCSVILSSRAPIGHLVINTAPMATNQGCKGLVPKLHLHYKYLFYYLGSIVPLLNELGTGATFKELSGGKLKEVAIPLPTLHEQQRIVAILDEAFAGLATAKANAEKNLKNAQYLPEAAFALIFNKGAGQWPVTTIGDQVTLQRGFDITKRQQNTGRVPVVSSGGIKSFHDTAMAKGPGVVLGRKGSLGTVYYMTEDYWPHDTTLWVKDFKGSDPKFVYYFFKSLDLAKLDSGAANPALNRNVVHPLVVNWPDRDRQAEIVEQIEKVSSDTVRLGSNYKRSLDSIAALKQSILQKAFSGELTASPSQVINEAAE